MSTETFIFNASNVYNGNIMRPIYVAKITSAGQLSIPKEVREKLGLKEEQVILEPMGDVIVLRRIKTMKEELQEYFRRETKARGITKKDMWKALKAARKKVFEEVFHGKL
ncbi:MAG: AbrB/MazE/SpoVT family DNA-binding domain-containing protein [Methanomassiliicoccales archaeon]|nr:MAG: AbrB/MazE/SpoVT family DNA-binding domain-containing protein [Methanomassiliicoccales archaeon]